MRNTPCTVCPAKPEKGFSLVEIMVGLAIGLLTMLVIMRLFADYEGQKRTTTSSADAQENGQIALLTLERDIRMGGYGIANSAAMGCPTRSSYNGVEQLPSRPLVPIQITDGASSDTVRVLYSSSSHGAITSIITVDHPPQSSVIFVNNKLGMTVDDFVVAFEPGKTCTLMQVTLVDNGLPKLHHASTSPWNPPCGQNILPKPDGYAKGALLFNFGSLVDRTYRVDANKNLEAFDFSAQTTETLADNVVNIQARYGVAPAGSQSVNEWVDATGIWAAPTPANIKRIKAVRIAVVARSALREKPGVDGVCHTTPTAPNSWPGGPAVDLTGDPDWQCYRYKVYETIVPLRNVLWANL